MLEMVVVLKPPAAPWPFVGDLPAVAIIVPTRNKPELLRKCLAFLDFPNRFRPELDYLDERGQPRSLRFPIDAREHEVIPYVMLLQEVADEVLHAHRPRAGAAL